MKQSCSRNAQIWIFFRASKEGGYEAARIVVEELRRKSLPSPIVLHVTPGQTTVTTAKTVMID
jgi:hypothetical protein